MKNFRIQRTYTLAPWEEQVGYCRATRAGRHVFVSGTAPVADDGGVHSPGNAYEQAKRCLQLIKKSLDDSGWSRLEIVRTRMFVTDIDRWAEYGRAHREFFEGRPPATSMVEVRRLIASEMLIEIEADAVIFEEALPNESATKTWTRPGYAVSTDPTRLDLDFVHRELGRSYWSPGISKLIVEKSIGNSMAFGVYRADGGQVGFARLVTDAASFAYLCDVVITESERGKGLGRWLNECIAAHPDLQGLRRWMLATKDAHDLYRRTGWSPLKTPEKFMERHFPDVYGAQA